WRSRAISRASGTPARPGLASSTARLPKGCVSRSSSPKISARSPPPSRRCRATADTNRGPPMESTFTDRYVHAVTRTLPEQQRGDVADELRASIADQIEDRLEAGAEADEAERDVLNALGDPDALAAGYA